MIASASVQVRNGEDAVVLAGEVVEEHGVGGAAVLVGGGSRLHGEQLHVRGDVAGLAVHHGDCLLQELAPPLDGAWDALSVVADVAEEGCKLTCLEHELAEALEAQGCLLLPALAGQIGIECDEDEIVGREFRFGDAEQAGIVAQHKCIWDQWPLLGVIRD